MPSSRKAAPRWRAIADVLAACLAVHAFCDTHPASEPDPACPFCGDRSAYLAYLQAGGVDSRLKVTGTRLFFCARHRDWHAEQPCGPEVTG